MATVKYQTWTNTTWAWDSATAGTPCVELLNEMRAWITAINGNASQSGKQVVLLRDETDSTTANYRGFTIECPLQTTTGSLYSSVFSSSSTVLRYYTGNGFTDDTSNGGYGTVGGTYTDSDTSILWQNTVTSSGSFIIGYSTVNGEEFFHWGWDLNGSTSTSDSFTIFKDQNGEWGSHAVDGAADAGLFWDENTNQFNQIANVETASNSSVVSPVLFSSSDLAASGETFRFFCEIKSRDILSRSTSTTQSSYAALTGGDNVVCSSYNGFWLRYTPV